MKQGKNIIELAAEVKRQAAGARDFVPRVSQINFVAGEAYPQPAMALEGMAGAPLVITPTTHTQLSTYADVPGKHYDRLRTDHPELWARTMTTILQKEHGAEKRFVRTLDGAARAFLSDRYRPLDNHGLMTNLLPYLMERKDITFGSAEVTPTRLYLKLISSELVGEVTKGDVVRMGLIIQNSEVGLGSLMIAPFSERLVCTNGATHVTLGQRRSHVGRALAGDADDGAQQFFSDETRQADDRAFFLKARDTVRAVLNGDVLAGLLESMRESAKDAIPAGVKPTDAVEAIANTLQLREGERDDVLEHLLKGDAMSRWGVANAITRAAQDATDYDRATELEKIGGDLLVGGRIDKLIEAGRREPKPERVTVNRRTRRAAAVTAN